MDELEPLAAAVRQELGTPPEAWQEAQRIRLRGTLRQPVRRPAMLRVAPWVFASLVVVGALIWVVSFRRPATGVERWLVADELSAPFRLDDGSSIALGPGGRGRLFADASSVRFDLHQGRASFDVVPERKRQWTISAGKNEVRVVGTRFSVFYGPGEAFDVEVERGVVAVRVPERNASIDLAAGDHLHGRPGQMEVLHGAAKASPAAVALEPKPEPAVEAPASPSLRAEPSASSSAEWQARYRAGKYAESMALVRSSGVGKRLNELGPSSLSDLADAARLGGDPELAVRALTALLQRYPSAPEARDGKFLLGRVHALRGDRAAAIEAFESYLRSGVSTLYVNETLGRLMELYSGRGNRDQAQEMARRYLERAPSGPYHRLARSLLDESR